MSLFWKKNTLKTKIPTVTLASKVLIVLSIQRKGLTLRSADKTKSFLDQARYFRSLTRVYCNSYNKHAIVWWHTKNPFFRSARYYFSLSWFNILRPRQKFCSLFPRKKTMTSSVVELRYWASVIWRQDPGQSCKTDKKRWTPSVIAQYHHNLYRNMHWK